MKAQSSLFSQQLLFLILFMHLDCVLGGQGSGRNIRQNFHFEEDLVHNDAQISQFIVPPSCMRIELHLACNLAMPYLSLEIEAITWLHPELPCFFLCSVLT